MNFTYTESDGNVIKLNEEHIRDLERNLMYVLPDEAAGTIEVDGIGYRFKRNEVWYSWEDKTNKLRRGSLEFTATVCKNNLEDVNFYDGDELMERINENKYR